MATRVVDSDAHVIEGQELMAELRARFPDKIRMARPDEEGAALVIEGRRYPNASGPGAGCHAKHGLCLDRGASPFTAEGVMRDADREGIDAMVFFPSAALGLPAFTDLAFAAECARLYNRWLAGYCGQFPRRMFGVGLVPIEDVATSIRVLREARELGLVAIMVPAVLRTRNLDHRDLESFYAAAEDLEMPLGIHGAPGIHLPPLGAERFDNYLQVHVVSFPFDMMVATTALVLGGVFERHPRLRVALLESGVGWVPYFFDRMDEHVEKRGRLTPECRRERRGYVAKREPVAGVLEPYDLEPEFRVLHALSDDPLPSPPTPWFTRDPAVLGRPFYVMERLPGEVPIPAARADGSGPFDDAERAALGPQVAHALARLHAIDWPARCFQFLGALGRGLGPRGRPRAPALLRGAHLRQDDRHHAERPGRLRERPHDRSAPGDLRPPASLSASPPRHDARLARGSAGMTIPLETLIDGLVRTLTDAVLPDVTSRFPRAPLFAVVDVLRNLRDRVEVKAVLHEAEAASAAAAHVRAPAALW